VKRDQPHGLPFRRIVEWACADCEAPYNAPDQGWGRNGRPNSVPAVQNDAIDTNLHPILEDAVCIPTAGYPNRLGIMNKIQTHRRLRNRLLVSVAAFIYLALLAVWEITTIGPTPVEHFGVLPLGVILGAVTGLGFVVRRLWYLYLASRP